MSYPTVQVKGCLSRGIASAIVVAAAVTSVSAATSPPVATLEYSVDGAPSTAVVLVGTPGPGGAQSFATSINGTKGEWQIVCNVTVDWTSNPVTSLLGTISITNLSSEPIDVATTFSVDICPAIEAGSLNGGSAKITLTSQGAGAITCSDSPYLIGLLSDEQFDGALFWCPFQIATTGSGSMTSTATLGLPGPNHPGATDVAAIGERISLNLTPGDTASIWSMLLFKDSNGYAAPTCPADLDDDKVVDGDDMGLLFEAWGTTSNCPANLAADLSGDGFVDAQDLIELLSHWGPCPQ